VSARGARPVRAVNHKCRSSPLADLVGGLLFMVMFALSVVVPLCIGPPDCNATSGAERHEVCEVKEEEP